MVILCDELITKELNLKSVWHYKKRVSIFSTNSINPSSQLIVIILKKMVVRFIYFADCVFVYKTLFQNKYNFLESLSLVLTLDRVDGNLLSEYCIKIQQNMINKLPLSHCGIPCVCGGGGNPVTRNLPQSCSKLIF